MFEWLRRRKLKREVARRPSTDMPTYDLIPNYNYDPGPTTPAQFGSSNFHGGGGESGGAGATSSWDSAPCDSSSSSSSSDSVGGSCDGGGGGGGE